MPSTSAWDPGHIDASLSLSGSNRIMTCGSAGAFKTVLGAQTHTTGKWYFEVAFNGTSAGAILAGIGDYGVNLGFYLGHDAHALSLYANSGQIFENGSLSGMNANTAGAFTICVAADLTARKAWFRYAGDPGWDSNSDDPTSGTGGFAITSASAMTPGASLDNNGDTATLNTGNAAFAQAAPSGFVAWG
jgi:hypothetical protein